MNESHLQQRYRVIEKLAAGGMAEVFLAESAGIEGFKKLVAIKRVLPALSEKTRFIAMFLDEARLSANLTHSNVAQVFDIGAGESAYFIVMEYVDGADLKAVLAHANRTGKGVPVQHACYIAEKLCEGLTYAHELHVDGQPLEIIHRDMSPPNVIISKYGEVKIVDFGLAKAASQLEKSEAGIIKGKFGYLSPEAARGEAIDHRTDLFAVGIILWEMLAGRRLFLGETDFATVKLVQEANIPSLRALNPAVPPDLEKILARALAREPTDRYATARDFGRDLNAFLFRYGKPVAAYDIADLVHAAIAQRKKTKPEKSTIIDRLIDEALLEFTSLQDDKAPPPVSAKGRKDEGKPGFEDIGHWADELVAPAARKSRSGAAPTEAAGAREDTSPKRRTTLSSPGSSKSVRTKAPSKAPVHTPSARKLLLVPEADPVSQDPPAGTDDDLDEAAMALPMNNRSRTTAVVVVVVAALLAAGAWFGGLIPHESSTPEAPPASSAP